MSLTATERMVSNFKTQPDAHEIVLTWTVQFLPSTYTLDVECEDAFSSGEVVERKGIKISPLARRYNITNLRPGSHCFIFFKAVYNPASLDRGISHIADTQSLGLPSTCSKSNRGISYTYIYISCAIQYLQGLSQHQLV